MHSKQFQQLMGKHTLVYTCLVGEQSKGAESVEMGMTICGFDCRLGIKESVNWLVDAMERSKRTDTLRVRAGSSVV